MNKRIKILSIFIALFIIGSVCVFSAYAADETVNPNPDTPPVVDPVPPVVDPVTPTQGGETPVDPTTGDGGGEVVTPTTGEGGGEVVDPTTEEAPTNPTPPDGNDYYYDEDDMVNNIDDYAGNVSDYTNLYDTSDFDEDAYKKTKWDDITIDVNKPVTDTDAMDFSSIKDNTSKEDDGLFILYLGYVLIALSIVGIIYFIVSTATYKKKLKALKAREQRQRRGHSERSRSDYGDLSEFPTQRDYNQRYRRYSSDNRSYSERKKSAKADTAEIKFR